MFFTYPQLTITTISCLVIAMLALLTGVYSHVQELQLIQHLTQQNTILSADSFDTLVNQHHLNIQHQLLIMAIPSVLAGLLSLYWLYRSHHRVHTMAPAAIFSPPQAVMWYFVPVMNLIKPFEAMQELVQRSQQAMQATTPATASLKPALLVELWWLLWIFAQIFYAYTLAQNPLLDDMEDIVALDIMFIGCNMIMLLLCTAFIALIWQIYRMQQHLPE